MPANLGDLRDAALIPGQEASLERGMAIHPSILAWRIPWTGAWWATDHRVVKSQTRLKRLSVHTLSVYLRLFEVSVF